MNGRLFASGLPTVRQRVVRTPRCHVQVRVLDYTPPEHTPAPLFTPVPFDWQHDPALTVELPDVGRLTALDATLCLAALGRCPDAQTTDAATKLHRFLLERGVL